MVHFLGENRVLAVLKLSTNQISNAGCEVLAEFLSSRKVEVLNLGTCFVQTSEQQD